MADPEGELVKTVLALAVRSAQNYLEEAARAQKNTAEACVAYLRAANATLDGLVGEYDGILTDAGTCDLTNTDQRQRLSKRIGTYLREYSLLTAMKGARDGITACLQILAKNPPAFLSLNPRRQLRQESVEKLSEALGLLQKYLIEIDEQWRNHRQIGTGIGALALHEMEKLLNDSRATEQAAHRDRLTELVLESTVNPERVKWDHSRPNIHEVIVLVNAAFV